MLHHRVRVTDYVLNLGATYHQFKRPSGKRVTTLPCIRNILRPVQHSHLQRLQLELVRSHRRLLTAVLSPHIDGTSLAALLQLLEAYQC